METKRINVLYKGQERIIELKPEDYNTYDNFIKKINEEFNENQIYQLMAMNSSEQFLILASDNYLRILNEEIPEGLKLFMSEMVKAPESNQIQENEIKIEKEEEKFEIKEEKVVDDEDFVIEGENDENKDNLNINIEQENIKNENEENKNKIEEENANIINNKIEENDINEDKNYTSYKSVVIRGQMNNENNDEENFEEKLNNMFNEIKGNKDNFYINNKYILTSNSINERMFNSEICSICGNKIKGIKYICCICDQLELCEECELYHNHPCFKYKNNFISTLYETCEFISKYYEYKLPHESTVYSKLFRKEYDLKIEPYSDLSFSLRPNKIIYIPFKILNYSKETIDSSQFVILIKNQKYIYLSLTKDKFEVTGKEYFINIKCITPNRPCPKENIFIELYSQEMPLKSSRRLLYEFNIEINFDSEDDKLNMELKNDESIYCFNKEHKRIALNLLKSSGNQYEIKNIFNCLFENNWDTHKALKALKKNK